MSKKILIIGGSGYIGTVLTKSLLSKKLSVINLDNLIFGNNIQKENSFNDNNYKFLHGDIAKISNFEKFLKGVTDVVILAAIVGDPLSKKYPTLAHQTNEVGVKTCLNYLNNKGIERVIFVSTCSNYGLINENEIADENFKLNPLSIYAKTKVNIEKYILSQKKNFDFSPTILRFATAFGLSPRMRFDLTVNQFTIELLLGKELEVYDPDTWRPYYHAQDFANIIFKILNTRKEKISYEVFNVGSNDNNFTKRNIVDLVSKLVPNPKIKILAKSQDKRNYRVNFKKINTLLNYKPISLKKGIEEIIQEFKKGKFRDYEKNLKSYGNFEILNE